MDVDHCEFPDDLFYDVGNDIWIRASTSSSSPGKGTAILGITSVLSFLAGKFTKVNLRRALNEVTCGQTIATVESSKYFGPVRSPLSGKIKEFNEELVSNPRLANNDPYGAGWFAKYESYSAEDFTKLQRVPDAAYAISSRLKELKVRCFKALPDDEMYSIGTECSTTLANLNQLLEKRPDGSVVHLVTDDPMSDIEMIRWSDQTKNSVLESRREGSLFHFIVKKEEEKRREEASAKKRNEASSKLLRRT